MVTDQDDTLIRAALAPARALEPSEDEVARVIARVRPATKRCAGLRLAVDWRRLAAPGLTALALLAAGLYSVPATRAGIEGTGASVGSAFSGWLGGDSAEAPGKPLEAGETMPEYLEYLDDPDHARDPRVIAEAGGYKLYSYIGPSGGLNFDLGDTGFGTGFESAAELGDAPLYVLGPGAMQHPDVQGHVPLFGIAARSVSSVELTYESGPPLRVDAIDGGFVLLAEPSRGPREVVALDSRGDVVGKQPVDNSPHAGVRIDWQEYVSTAAP
jgi:hypothetical protein